MAGCKALNRKYYFPCIWLELATFQELFVSILRICQKNSYRMIPLHTQSKLANNENNRRIFYWTEKNSTPKKWFGNIHNSLKKKKWKNSIIPTTSWNGCNKLCQEMYTKICKSQTNCELSHRTYQNVKWNITSQSNKH